ncbi:aldose 1-epimerase family protein [Limosilactobacillus antri]|uniref:aldose 1-epimerase family protein n=1 Tax=Limosilactobacillus antri TaxID=227943 RepID=UPI001F591AC6|nr:aldose 1-epimerase family protein [Limosilactobacillus antri]
MITLQNDVLAVEINELGAQLHSIKRRDNGLEYLWQGAANSWGRQAPILFPFVGRLKNDQYEFDHQTYHQTQHGFARDRQFAVVNQAASQVTLEQRADDETRQAFPFDFILRVHYQLVVDQLAVTYEVVNPADRSLIYAIGAHPGFNMPLTPTGDFNDVQFTVSPAEEYSRIVLEGPYNDSGHPRLIDMTTGFKLAHQLFAHDAIIFKTGGVDFAATLTDPATDHGVTVSTKETQYVGLWSAYPAKANFACIEPWWGIADNVNADGLLLHKQGMSRLAPGDSKRYHFSIKPF